MKYEDLKHLSTNKGPAIIVVESGFIVILNRLLGYKDISEFSSKFDKSEFNRFLNFKDQFYEEVFSLYEQKGIRFTKEEKELQKLENLILSKINFRFREEKYQNPHAAAYLFSRLGTDDVYIISEIMQDLYNMCNITKKNDVKTVIDLGGHVGSFSIMASILFPNTKIYSYEAVQENYDVILKNVAINKLENKISVFNFAVGGKGYPQEIQMAGSKSGYDKSDVQSIRNTGGNKIIWGEGDCGVNLETTTLKEIIEQNNIEKVDLLKLDIEGSEYQVLEYAHETGVLNIIDKMAMELHVNPKREREFDKIFKYLYDDFNQIIYNKHTKILLASK
jgi:FkbM family methyltransferase